MFYGNIIVFICICWVIQDTEYVLSLCYVIYKSHVVVQQMKGSMCVEEKCLDPPPHLFCGPSLACPLVWMYSALPAYFCCGKLQRFCSMFWRLGILHEHTTLLFFPFKGMQGKRSNQIKRTESTCQLRKQTHQSMASSPCLRTNFLFRCRQLYQHNHIQVSGGYKLIILRNESDINYIVCWKLSW